MLAGTEPDIDIFDGVASLVDKSLVRTSLGKGSQTCFSMLETIREYARERLDASPLERQVQRPMRAASLPWRRRLSPS